MCDAYFKLKFARQRQREERKNLPKTRTDALSDEERDKIYKLLLSEDKESDQEEKPIEE